MARKSCRWQLGLGELLILVAVSAVGFALVAQSFTTAKEAALKTLCVPALRQGGRWDREKAEQAVVRRLLFEVLGVESVVLPVFALLATTVGLTLRAIKRRHQRPVLLGGGSPPALANEAGDPCCSRT